MCVCVCVCVYFFFFPKWGLGWGKQDEWMKMEKSCQWNGNDVWVMCEGWWRVNLEILLTDCRERRHGYIEPIAIWAFHWLLESFWPWPGARETSDLKVSAFLSISLQCKSGYGFCLRLAENKRWFSRKRTPRCARRQGTLSSLIYIYLNKICFGTYAALGNKKGVKKHLEFHCSKSLLSLYISFQVLSWGIDTERYYKNMKKIFKKSSILSLPYFLFCPFLPSLSHFLSFSYFPFVTFMLHNCFQMCHRMCYVVFLIFKIYLGL